MVDILIVGGGPAGLTAAIYARRAQKSVLLIERDAIGGQMTQSPKIENYPGCPDLSGNALAEAMLDRVLSLGADISLERVTAIAPLPAREGFLVTTDETMHEARCVILATGVKHRRLRVPGEEELTGRGVSYCAVCDGAFYREKDVAVIGGGNSATQEATLLAGICRRVTIVQDLPTLTAEESSRAALARLPNVEIRTSRKVIAFCGEGALASLRLTSPEGEEILPVCGAFVAIGLEPDNAAFADLIALEEGYIAAGEDCETTAPGIFAAGDCRTKSVRQITTATSDGSVAALAAIRYLDRRASCA